MIETATKVKERPIIMSGEMVRAILEGRKTQTRRVMKPQPFNPQTFGISPIWGSGVPNGEDRFCVHAAFNEGGSRVDKWLPCPYGQPGDRMWVKETYALRTDIGADVVKARHYAMYRADGSNPRDEMNWHDYGGKWRSSLFMPRWASRIMLEIVNVRVERVQEISEEDAKSEGVFGPPESGAGWRQYPYEACCMNSARMSFMTLWDSINAKTHPWSSNPFVWVIEFKRLETT